MNKLPLEKIYQKLKKLESEYNWTSNAFYDSKQNPNAKKPYPIMSFSSPKKGKAIWIISGIHGEEPAGPNAIARNIDFLGNLGNQIPLVLFPLCNPVGYLKSWRYPYQDKWHKDSPNISVGDSEHYLQDLNNPNKPRINNPSCIESQLFIKEIIKLSQEYPIKICLDLHEDNMIDEGYIYAYGTNPELRNYFAKRLLTTLRKKQVKIKTSGKTRFDERIEKGLVEANNDGSIDELLSSKYLILNDKRVKGPNGEACFVVETPAASLPLEKRVNAHLAIIELIKKL